MKKRIFTILAFILIAVLALAACSPQPEPIVEEPAEMEEAVEEPEGDMEEEMEEPAQEEGEMEEEDEMEKGEVDVAALIEERVAGNHGLDQIFNATKTREEWQETLERMNGYGAGMSDEEIEIIIDYLLSMQEPAEEAMEEVDVEALIEERVAGNHGLAQIFNATKTREEWQETLERMNGYGAGMSDEEIELIIEYLLNR